MGSIMGGLLFGYIADNYGRIPALIGCNLFGSIAGGSGEVQISSNVRLISLSIQGMATVFVNNFWQFALCRFFVGFAFDGCFAMLYILGKWIDVNHTQG